VKYYLIVSIIFVFCSAFAVGRPVCKVTLYDENSGMAQQHVTQIVQDKRGMMWFATWNGINRFDGYEFECFKSRPGDGCVMPTDRIRNIVINSTGNIWCLVDDRIFLFNIATNKFTDISTPLERKLRRNLSIASVTASGNGTSWFGCKNGTTLILEDHNPIGGKTKITRSKGNKMITAKGNEDKRTWNLTDGRMFMFNQTQGKVWFAMHGSSLYMAKNTSVVWQKIRDIHTDSDHKSSYIHEDESGIIWIITPDGALCYYDSTTGTMPEYKVEGTKIDDVNGYYEDRQHNLWLRSKNGVYKLCFTNQPASPLQQQNRSQIRCLFIDSKHRYWVTDKENSTVRIFSADNKMLGYLHNNGTISTAYASFGASIYCIAEQRNGTLWLGSKPKGLFRLTSQAGGRYRVEQFKHSSNNRYTISSNDIYDIKEDNRNRLWIATLGGGINCIADTHANNPIFYNSNNILKTLYPQNRSNKVRALHITNNSIMLAATTEGLLIGDIRSSDMTKIIFRRHCREANREKSLSNDATMNILEDHHRRIFVCTESGGVNEILSRNLLDKSLDFKHFTTLNGLTTDVILSLFEDKNNIWLVGDNQIMRLNPNNGHVENFDIHFWKESYHFSDAVPLKLPNGRWLFAHTTGAFMVALCQLIKGAFIPPISLTGLTIQNRETNLAVNALDTILLHPDERNITIHFAALDYTDASQISYAFRLVGKGGEWSYIHKGHSATFLDMQPGTYMLEIRSTNSDGQWVNNIRKLTIIVEPTFWETGWAMALYILMGIGIILGIFYIIYYIRGIKQQRKEILDSYLALLKEKPADDENRILRCLSKPQLSAEDDAFMKRILAFVDENVGNADITIDDMASASATSRSGLNRKMKSTIGMTPLDFLNEARIQKACKLLKENQLHVSEIAFLCGFSDPKYFSRCFKKTVNMTPSEYREKNELC
jgi:AraC-like DNA-binding protein/ligand-binding sensor domain-containing protein